jgi:hypothetical protein
MKRNPNLLWITVVVLGWLIDFLFWQKPLGLNFALYTVLCLAGGLFVLAMDKQHPARGTLWLFPLVLFFAAITFVRTEPMTLFLGFACTLFLMSLLAMTFIGGRWLRYSLADYVSGLFRLAGSMVARPVTFDAEVKREQVENGLRVRKFNPWPILRGIVIALPIVAIFASLLASADAVFSDQLGEFIKFFRIENLPQYIFRLAYILAGAYLLAGVFLHATSRSKDEKLIGEDKPLVKPFLGFTETAIVLGSVVALFAAFVVIQFRYFFGGQANINLAGFTYSEYARRGFGELMAVAFFSLLMILGLGVVARREDDNERRIYSGLNAAIVVLVMVMLVSAYQRLLLYEAVYGFSRLRTYTHVLLIWIGILLGAVVLLEIFHRERAFAAAALIATLGIAASLSLLNVDGFIVRQNVDRAVKGQGLDVAYLVSLSSDTVPVLVNEFQSTALPGLTRDAVGAVLFCRLQSDSTRSGEDWRSFTLSEWQAKTAINEVRAQLGEYRVIDNQWPLKILTPGSVSYNCHGSGID